MMETAEEHEQDVVTSSLSPNSVVDSLDKFLKKPENERVLTFELEQILIEIAKTGYSSHPWEKIKPLYLKKLSAVLNEFNTESNMDKLDTHPNVDQSTFEELKSDIIERINSFENAPFTIQRLCELILSPRANYRRTDKFIRGLTKCVSVVTTIDNEGNKIYVETTRNGFTSSTTADSSETSSNSQITNGFAIPHAANDNDSIVIESQESQAGSAINTQLDDEMEQDNNDNEQDEDEEDKPSLSSSPPTNLTDENSSSSNSNSTPLPSSSTEDMLEQ
ncbi:unnamed protein product [Rotaria magnacalcarata]|uniref:Serine/threonine-protein phosphatase 4 regulatory subunit 2 n=2 Tax=Rotaria magnacalcarata TaxID=392030 RepID=A0A818XIJ9_9BILA|nr:unnamed protein product [Rotaria magnacalcarata]CAF2058976.1 unnamed protein product [Rotaria magnacalcarata]CAF2181603.1 unnamed protein product [Rotaria magnacalcarata]CAF3741033.1 unnamed protein product [Rotaria magnacalcarata]CAF3753581.1 unnamed protein product [Rotaria magnacalcarata]